VSSFSLWDLFFFLLIFLWRRRGRKTPRNPIFDAEKISIVGEALFLYYSSLWFSPTSIFFSSNQRVSGSIINLSVTNPFFKPSVRFVTIMLMRERLMIVGELVFFLPLFLNF
jgi:hypothetical protein